MKWPVKLLISSVIYFSFSAISLVAAPYLEMKASCQGWQTGKANRYKIIGWNGHRRRAFSQNIYNFRIDCNGSIWRIADVFMASVNSGRHKMEGGVVYKIQGTRRQSVKVRDRQCKTYFEDGWCTRASGDLYNICRGNVLCEILFSTYRCRRVWEDCRPARYEMRTIPVWAPFPIGYAPLPYGANIVDISENQLTAFSSQKSRTAIRNPSGSGFGIGQFLLFSLFASAGTTMLLWSRNAPLRNRNLAARQSIAREYQGFGIDVPVEGFRWNRSGFLRKDLENELTELNSQLSSLKKSRELYRKTSDLVIELERTCGELIYDKLNEDIGRAKEILKPEGLISYLKWKDWSTFQRYVTSLNKALQSHLDHIQNLREKKKREQSTGRRRDRDKKSQRRRKTKFDGLPTSRGEACALLNISEDTPIEIANRKYRNMAKAWHVDRATSEENRKLREKKLTELNVAMEYIRGERK